MKKSRFLTWGGMVFALCAMFVMSSCKSDDEKDNGGNVVPPQEEQTSEPGTMKHAKFYGVVKRKTYSDWGASAICEGVKVTSGDQTVTTDANGYYQFENVKVVNGRAVLKFEKKGFMTVVRSVPMQEGMRMDVTMLQADMQEGFEASNGELLQLVSFDRTATMTIRLPADGFVRENGSPYNGIVWPMYAYLDPDDATFATQMPGDLSAIREDQSAAQLISYGMFVLELWEHSNGTGEKINLAPGQKATVKFPIPDKFKGGTLPTSIPLWSFNEETGLWEEEGEALLDGEWYKGEVSHFSWHNLDCPEITATIKLTVKDSNGKPLVGVPIDISGQRQYFTDTNGQLRCDIPSDADVYVRVPSEYYGNYAGDDPSKEAKTTVNLSGGETREVTLTVPAACAAISGKVKNTGSGSNICSLSLAYYTPDTWWRQTSSTITDIEGNFLLYAPPGVAGPAQIVATFADGMTYTHEFRLTGADQVVNFSVNSQTSSATGVITVVNAEMGIKATYYLPAPSTGGYWETAVITNTHFHADMGEQKGEIDWDNGETIDMISFNASDYNAAQGHADKATFFWMKEGGPHLRIEASDKPAEITKNGDIYTIKMTNVDGTLEDQMREYDYANVKVTLEFSVKESPAP